MCQELDDTDLLMLALEDEGGLFYIDGSWAFDARAKYWKSGDEGFVFDLDQMWSNGIQMDKKGNLTVPFLKEYVRQLSEHIDSADLVVDVTLLDLEKVDWTKVCRHFRRPNEEESSEE